MLALRHTRCESDGAEDIAGIDAYGQLIAVLADLG